MFFWIVMLLGVALWWGAHLLRRLAPGVRNRFGEAAPGVMALTIVVSIVLMVIGYRGTPFVQVWSPPGFMIHINNLLMVIALFMASPARKRGRLMRGVRHGQSMGFVLWAIAHLLVNGDLASILLFGLLLAWVPVTLHYANRANPGWVPRTDGSYGRDAMFFAATLVLFAVIAGIHIWLGVSPFPS